MMNEDEYFEWLEGYCRRNNYGVSAQTVCQMASEKGVDLGSVLWVGRKHLIPRGWIAHITTRSSSTYLPPERGGGSCQTTCQTSCQTTFQLRGE